MAGGNDAPSDPNLDAGLRAAFERSSRPSSILDRIRELDGVAPNVLLRDVPEDDTPVVSAARGTASRGRYQMVGEIARGGVGVILKGRDVDLGRDVAMKIIRPEHAHNPDVLQRFIEEAQIGGQLQHPGMTPVYELGVDDERRAYFTMKLIKGRTLASLLTARADAGAERARFLAVFEQICQTVAYAHARGVIHRDLKPSNVMVGAFGEVQVVDWGFAKVLARGGVADEHAHDEQNVTRVRTVRTGSTSSHSQAGSVMGTPAYMPPEQALGHVDLVDERSDVFALGAILCEILTGRPPYARGGNDAFLQAAQADLADAFSRLDGCAADPELIHLARRCLAADRARRPPDAGKVAAAVARHQAAVEERARAAEVEAAEAKVKAQAERRARRLTVGLAASVLLALAAVGTGYLWVEREKRESALRAADTARKAIDEARQLRERAREEPLVRLAEWDAALAAARRAADLAGDADKTVMTHASDLLALLSEEAPRWRANAALVRDLEEVRLERGDRFDLTAADAAYAALFHDRLGLDPDSPADAGGALSATGIADLVAPYLDEWCWIRGQRGQPRSALAAVANRIDPNPWRVRVRAAGVASDPAELSRAAASLDDDAFEGSTPYLLALHLSATGENEHALALLREAQLRRPDDFWLSYQLARELTLVQPPRWQESLPYYAAALAARPESLEVRRRMGIAYQRLGELDLALQAWHDALRIDPEYLRAYEHVLEVHEQRGELDEVLRIARTLADRAPDDALAQVRLGHSHAIRNEWPAAQEAYARAVALAPGTTSFRVYLADAFLYEGNRSRAEEILLEAISVNPESHVAYAALGRVYHARREWSRAADAYRRAADLKPEDAEYRRRVGQALHWLKDYAGARQACERAVTIDPDYAPSYATLAHVLREQGELDGAISNMRRFLELRPLLAEGRWHTAFRLDMLPTGDTVPRVQMGLASKPIQYFQLALFLVLRGERTPAIECLEKLLAVFPDHPQAAAFLGTTLLHVGRVDDAIARIEESLARRPEWFWAHYDLGFALLAAGRYEEAIEHLGSFRDAHTWPASWRFTDEEWQASCADLVRAARDAPAVLRGERGIAPRTCLVLARMLDLQGRYVAAARLYRQALEAEPRLGEEFAQEIDPWRVYGLAAETAMRAAWMEAADNGDIGEAERAAWRRLSREWLRRDIATWRRELGRGDPQTKQRAGVFFENVGEHPLAFSFYRFRSNVDTLDEREASECRAVWEEFQALNREVNR